MFGNTSISLEDICNNQDKIDSSFDCVHTGYRAIIRLFDSNTVYQSKKLFDSYEDAWFFVREESKCFKSCEMYVIESSQFPTLDLSSIEISEQYNLDNSTPCSSFDLKKLNICSANQWQHDHPLPDKSFNEKLSEVFNATKQK